MKTNINTDNYEAYLLDYMEGNLSSDEAEQLKTFVAAQGLDWAELTQELPHLEAPALTYDGKEQLKQRSLSLSKGRSSDNVIPLYVKIASAAAAAGLLLTVTLWPEKSLPKVEPVAKLKPILSTRLITSEEGQTLPPRTISFALPKAQPKKQPEAIRTEATLLADLQPRKAESMQITIPTSFAEEPNLDLIAYRLNTEFAAVQFNANDYAESYDDEQERSLIGKGISLLTNGRHNNLASLINTGLNTAKKEISLAATDVALTAYHRADERIEEAKERWEEKRGE